MNHTQLAQVNGGKRVYKTELGLTQIQVKEE
ncbi:hypothetical protein [Leuconostoc gelidum]|nr:hypothetical protein [Leuconostoc gelidum]